MDFSLSASLSLPLSASLSLSHFVFNCICDDRANTATEPARHDTAMPDAVDQAAAAVEEVGNKRKRAADAASHKLMQVGSSKHHAHMSAETQTAAAHCQVVNCCSCWSLAVEPSCVLFICLSYRSGRRSHRLFFQLVGDAVYEIIIQEGQCAAISDTVTHLFTAQNNWNQPHNLHGSPSYGTAVATAMAVHRLLHTAAAPAG